MGKPRKNKSGNEFLSPQLMQQYLEGKLPAPEMHRVEKLLLEDDFQQDALEGLSQKSNPETISSDLSNLRSRLKKRTQKDQTTIPFYRNRNWQLAASFALLLLISGIIYLTINSSLPEEESVADQHAPTTIDSVESESLAQQKDESSSAQIRDSLNNTLALKENLAERQQNFSVPNQASSKLEDNNKEKEADTITEKPPIALLESAQPEAPLPKVASKDEELSRNLEDYLEREKAVSSAKKMKAYNFSDTNTNSVQLSGKIISSADNENLPGVNVIVKGTNTGTVTDADGNFSLEVPLGKQEIQISTIGFLSKENQFVFRQDTSLVLKLDEDVQALSEVVVMGYGATGNNEEVYNSYQRAYPIPNFKSFNQYLKENLRYPANAKENNIEGKVKVEFYINAEGALRKLQIKKSLGYGCDEEAIRLLKEGPLWKPAERNGNVIEQKTVIAIKFKMNQ